MASIAEEKENRHESLASAQRTFHLDLGAFVLVSISVSCYPMFVFRFLMSVSKNLHISPPTQRKHISKLAH